MNEIVPALIAILLLIFWGIIPIYKKISKTNIGSAIYNEHYDDKLKKQLKKLTKKTSEKKLRNIYAQAKAREVKSKIIRISKSLDFINIALTENDVEIAIKAAKRVQNQEQLVQLILSENTAIDSQLKNDLLSKITDEKILKAIVLQSNEMRVVLTSLEKMKEPDSAIKEIKSDEKLINIGLSKTNNHLKLNAVYYLQDVQNIMRVGTSKTEYEIKTLAYDRIKREYPERFRELILNETIVKFLVNYFESSETSVELLKDISFPDIPLPMKLLLLENDFKNMIENTNIIENLFTKGALHFYADIISAKKENNMIKKEIRKRDIQINQRCDLIIENEEDNSEYSKPENLIEMIKVYNSYKDLFASFNSSEEVVQFIQLFEKYSGIYDLEFHFYNKRGEYLDHYDSTHSLTDMGRYYDIEERAKTKNLDFNATTTRIYDILKESLNRKVWWEEAIQKSWFNSFSFYVLDNGHNHDTFRLFGMITYNFLLENITDRSRELLTTFARKDFKFLDAYKKDELFDFVGELRNKLELMD